MERATNSSLILYTTEDGLTKIEATFDRDTVWLSIDQMADLFQRNKSTISRHIGNIYKEGELDKAATVAKFATVQMEGERQVERQIEYYNLDVIISVGYRVKSQRGVQFRMWATAILKEFMKKGFVLDDDRLKNLGGGNYFDELLARIRDIRSSEKVFWRKVLEIYATSIDYDPKAESTVLFFKQVQNKMHWAAHQHTAAEVIYQRADAEKEHITNLGMQLFVCCFSLKEDSLPMWNYYTKEINSQGYNIEFDDKKLVESILRSNPVLDGCSFSFGNVDYSKDNDSEYSHILTNGLLSSMEVAISKIFLAVVTEMSKKQASGIDQSALRELEKKVSDSEREQKLDSLPVYVYQGEQCSFEKAALSDCLSFIKRDCFNQESEFRIVISVPDELLDKLSEMGVYKFRAGNGILIPYIELKFSENAVKSITISPTVQSDLVESSIRDFLQYCKYNAPDFSNFIKHSNIPVRF